jgi:HAD superfamily hydrolase (TIGR01509 family)
VLAIFDIGNTLVTGPSLGPARRIAGEFGLDDGARRALHEALMTTPFAGPAAVAEHLGDPRAEPVVEAIWRAQERDARAVPGAAALLESLRRDGVALALLSNIWPPYLVAVRRHFGALFDALVPRALQVFSFEARDAKPSPALFERVLRAAGAAAGEAVMIGDSLRTDIAPAAALGLKTVWVSPDPSATVASVTDLDAGAVRALLST